jgi:hypothetical protein
VRTPLLIVAPVVLLAACSSGSSRSGSPSVQATSAPTQTATTAATRAAVPRQSQAPAGRLATTTAPTGPAPTTGSTTGSAPVSTQAPGKPAASKATAPGTYTYDSRGKVTFGTTTQDASGTQTLTVGPLRNGVQRSTLHGDSSGDTRQDVLVRDAGSYLADLTLTSPAFTKDFRPAPAVLLMPDPAVVGRSWSWSAPSTDGKTHVASTNRLVRQETLTIGGTRVSTVVLQTHLVLSGDVSYDAQVTAWWAPGYRLPVKNHTVGKGSYSNVPFSTDIAGVMQSVKPA